MPAWLGSCRVRTVFLVYRWLSSCCIFTWLIESQLALWPILIKALISFMRLPPRWPSYLPNIPPAALPPQLCCAGAANSRGDIPHVQGKEQCLHFAGAAMKRYPRYKVRETPVRWQALRKGFRGQIDWNHNHRKLTNLITWTIALSNSMKLWTMQCRATQDGRRSWWRVLTKCGPLEKGMANHFSILDLRTPWTVWKSKKIRHGKINSPGQ